jgi:hypothetical protein
MLRILHCRVVGLAAIVITSTYMFLIATLDATYAQTFVPNSTELKDNKSAPCQNCSDAAGVGPGAAAPDMDPKGFDKFKKHFKPNGKKPKLCDIIAYGPKGEQPSHMATVVGFTPNGDPLTVGQNGSPPAATAPASHTGNVTLNSADTWQNTGKQNTDWESYTPIDDPATGQPPALTKDITDKSAEAEKHQTPTNKAEKEAWLAIWKACHERNFTLMGADASGTRTVPISFRSMTPQSADAPQYVALPPTNSSTGLYAGGQIIKNSGRVRSTETSAATGEVTNQFSDSGDQLGVGIVAGYNFRPWNNNIVVGPFASFDYLKQTINHTFAGGQFLGTTTHWIVTAGAKGGFVVTPRVYLYGLVGASWLNHDLNINFATTASRNTTTPGFTLGLGGEYQPSSWRLFGNPVSVFLQYQHTWWGTANFNTPTSSPGFNYAFKRDDDTIKLGVNVYLSAPTPPPPTRGLITK